MRHNNNSKRSRGRNSGGRSSGGRKSGNPRNQIFDSNGPSVRIRGHALQIFEKYQQLSRDASSTGDRVMAENLQQHAEHYYRLAAASGAIVQVNRDSDEATADPAINSGDAQMGSTGNGGAAAGPGNGTQAPETPKHNSGRPDAPRSTETASEAEAEVPSQAVARTGDITNTGDAPASDDAADQGQPEAKQDAKPRKGTRRPRDAKAANGDAKAANGDATPESDGDLEDSPQVA